ncbi:MAG: bifunctional [glutamate--ammonia ligase]-adenylyl-L-tyrosine phosphorylase/[glutamate--ammonia-ligase] adenylyltransferase [Gammaproteobacteria bacterium]|nr:bifunctional [glutamate--ammonia ligase]-adenylyl-L-tyrosine phosphorylase/[glutamate--ammonia-ligase] adenylyltransferase [Gammaproteobacteria bacterium]
MGNSVQSQVLKAINALPQDLQRPVARWFERLAEQHGLSRLPVERVEALARVVACSEFGGTVVLQNWGWFVENVASFSAVGDPNEASLDAIAHSNADLDEVKSQLRRIRNRKLLRIVWREICGLAKLDETLEQLSGLADSMLNVATRYAERMLEPRYGRVRDSAGQKVPLVILGMGKLGGRELNFSSDIDLIFLFTEDGETDGDRTVSAQEYFGRLSRLVISLIEEPTPDGFVFRIDIRLRPFGESGPPVVSFAALESYLLQHGRDWERYAYVKARVVGAESGVDVRNELNRNVIKPFVYRRYLDYGVFESLREMHAMIAAEVRHRELVDNVKLGPGGIREVEFIVQSFQLVRGGSEDTLQGRELQEVLPKLVSSRGLSAESAEHLQEAYRFLRRLENFIQAIRDQQTHDLPRDAVDQARLCLAMGYTDWEALNADLEKHRAAVSLEFNRVAFREHSDGTPMRQQLARAWEASATEEQWRELLEQANAENAADLAAGIVSFANAATNQQIDSIAAHRLHRFVPELVAEVIKADKPLPALTRTLSVIERVLRRSAYLALLNENRAAMTRLVDLCGRSQYIADQIALYPVLLDELLDPRIYSAAVTKPDLSAELRRLLMTVPATDSEAQMDAIVQYQTATKFRIAVADFNGSLPIMKVSDSLTWLAETVLDEALRVAWRDLTTRHGVPCYIVDSVAHEAGFGIVGYGKLGGLELSYGSDLDIVFLHDSHGESQQTNGEKPLDNTMFFARLVRRLVLFLTTQTGSGELYEIDTRLRPDGHKGLLVTSTGAFERYQEDNAWTWEHQALLRARAVAGSVAVAKEFERIRKDTLIRRVKRGSLRDDVISMRQRMRKELDRSNTMQFDLKHGSGGIGDIEFLVQYLVLNYAKAHPDVIFYSDNIRQLDALTTAGCLERAVGDRLQDCYRSYRLRQHHLVLDGQPPLAGAEEFQEERGFVANIWDQWLD